MLLKTCCIWARHWYALSTSEWLFGSFEAPHRLTPDHPPPQSYGKADKVRSSFRSCYFFPDRQALLQWRWHWATVGCSHRQPSVLSSRSGRASEHSWSGLSEFASAWSDLQSAIVAAARDPVGRPSTKELKWDKDAGSLLLSALLGTWLSRMSKLHFVVQKMARKARG